MNYEKVKEKIKRVQRIELEIKVFDLDNLVKVCDFSSFKTAKDKLSLLLCDKFVLEAIEKSKTEKKNEIELIKASIILNQIK